MSKYAAIFTLLLRLRQTCDHPFLVMGTAASVGRGLYVTTAGRDAAEVPSAGKPLGTSDDALADLDEDYTDEAPPQHALPPALIAELYAQLVLRRMRSAAPQALVAPSAGAIPAAQSLLTLTYLLLGTLR